MMKRTASMITAFAAFTLGAATSPLPDAAAYTFTVPPHTNLIEGRVMGPSPSYRILRAEDCYYLAEAAAERLFVAGLDNRIGNVSANLRLSTSYLKPVDTMLGFIPSVDTPGEGFGYLTDAPGFAPFSTNVEATVTDIIAHATNGVEYVATNALTRRLRYPALSNITNRFAFMDSTACAFLADIGGISSNRITGTETIAWSGSEPSTDPIDSDIMSFTWEALETMDWGWVKWSDDGAWSQYTNATTTLTVTIPDLVMAFSPAPYAAGVLFALTSSPARAEKPRAIIEAVVMRDEWRKDTWYYSESGPLGNFTVDKENTIRHQATTNFVYFTADLAFVGPTDNGGVPAPLFTATIDKSAVSAALSVAGTPLPTLEDVAMTTEHEDPADSPSYGKTGAIIFTKDSWIVQDMSFSVVHIFLDTKFKTTLGGNR